MTQEASPLAIVFADISGSTRLYELLGDVDGRAKVARCLQLLTEVVEHHGGEVIKTLGDEVMCTFPEAEQAAIAACDMQETVEVAGVDESTTGPAALAIRVGLHFGPALRENGDVFGDAVNVAARMAAMAKAGQIITTGMVVDALPRILRANARKIDRAPVKGKKDTMDIYELLWQQEDVTRMSTGVLVAPETGVRLNLIYRGTTVVVDHNRAQVAVGRGKTADMAVEEPLASRLHARIELRRGKFFVIDQSTNGTYVRIGENTAFLRREEMPLSGRGAISLGRPFEEAPRHVVQFNTDA